MVPTSSATSQSPSPSFASFPFSSPRPILTLPAPSEGAYAAGKNGAKGADDVDCAQYLKFTRPSVPGTLDRPTMVSAAALACSRSQAATKDDTLTLDDMGRITEGRDLVCSADRQGPKLKKFISRDSSIASTKAT